MNWWMIVAISAVTATYVQADTCAECISTYGTSAQSCTEATTYSTCANAATNAACTDAEKATATKAVSGKCTDGGTCDKCSTTYDADVDATGANKCTVADTYVTCLNGVNDACGTTLLVDTKSRAATNREEFCTTGCNGCKSTYEASTKTCTDATTYDTCAKTTCSSNNMSVASTAVTNKCNSAGSITVSMVFTSLMMAAVSLVRV